MELLKKICYATIFIGIIATTLQCASSKEGTTFETPTSFKVKPVSFQEWYAGIKVGGAGINVFVSVVNRSQDIVIDSIYFRNLKGKLVEKNDKYQAILKNKSRHYTFNNTEKSNNYPFTLTDNECAISYIENGQKKYHKITEVNEVAGIFYENGPPSIYESSSTSILATTDDDDDDE